jgi:hypothetical protein
MLVLEYEGDKTKQELWSLLKITSSNTYDQ